PGKPDLPEWSAEGVDSRLGAGARVHPGRAEGRAEVFGPQHRPAGLEGPVVAGQPGRARLSRVRVYLGSDHAGFELKSALAEAVAAAGHDVVDCGPPAYRPGDDYPPYVMRAAAGAAANPGSAAVVVGGAGHGGRSAP